MDLNITNKITNIVANDTITLKLNITYHNTFPIKDTQNFTWTILINQEECNYTNAQFNNEDNLTHLNCTAPKLDGNPISNNLSVSANYSGIFLDNYNNNISYFFANKTNAIVYKDITAPSILFYYNLTNQSNANFNKTASFYIGNNASFCINVSDNWAGTKNVSVRIISPNETQIFYLENKTQLNFNTPNSTSLWCLNENFTLLGDYKVNFSINDSNNNLFDNNLYYFEIYENKTLNFTSLENVDNATLNFKLYIPNTKILIDEFEINESQLDSVIHNRSYDARIIINFSDYKHSVLFKNASFTRNLINILNATPVNTSIIIPPIAPNDNNNYDKFNYIVGLSVSSVLDSSADLSLEYGNIGGIGATKDFVIYRCNSYNIGQCNSWNCIKQNKDIFFDRGNKILTFSVNSFSTYLVVERGIEKDMSPHPGSSSGSSSGSGSGTTTTTIINTPTNQTIQSVCGNNICE
ncbi:MAG: hypothetical protein B6U87_02920, partial [Candidatus Aenigmarchaeota archaeon ex4484_52]